MWISQLGGARGRLGRFLVIAVAKFALTLLLDIEKVQSKICINHDDLALLRDGGIKHTARFDSTSGSAATTEQFHQSGNTIYIMFLHLRRVILYGVASQT